MPDRFPLGFSKDASDETADLRPAPRTVASDRGAALPYGLVVLDVDGTLLNPSGVVTARVREALLSAHEAGCIVVLASGRRLWAIRPIVEALGFPVPVILYNGAIVYDLDGETILWDAHLPPASVSAALELLWNAGHQPVLFGHPTWGEHVFTGPPERDTPATRHYFNRPTTQPRRCDLDGLISAGPALLLTAMGGEPQMRDLEAIVQRRKFDCRTLVERQSFVTGSPWWQLDVTANDCSKGAALKRLCDFYDLPLSRTIAIGDGINDLDLIQTAALGVAMGNAVPAVIAAAGARVSDNASDGVAEAMERYVLQAHLR